MVLKTDTKKCNRKAIAINIVITIIMVIFVI